MLARLVARVRGHFARRRIDDELADELRFHVAREMDAYRARGLTEAEARRRALADLGGVVQTTEAVRSVRALGLDRVRTDVRDAWRGLRGGRGTTILAFGIMALIIGAATVTFTVVDGAALRPLPYRDPGRLVGVSRVGASGPTRLTSAYEYLAWRDGTRAFTGLGAAQLAPPLPLEVGGATGRVRTWRATANLFDVLGVRPAYGRFFDAAFEHPGGPMGLILSHDLWVRRFDADPRVIGRFVTFDQVKMPVIGVLPAGVSFPAVNGADVYIPYIPSPRARMPRAPRSSTMAIVGRLRPGVSVEQAQADVTRVSPGVVLPLLDQIVGPARTWLILLLTAVGLVLLVACVNVASLLVARATTRTQELAMREALGASRGRVAGVLVLEGAMLASAAAAAGILVSHWGVQAIVAHAPAGLFTRQASIAVDTRVLVVAIAATLVCGLIFGGAPAWFAMRTELVTLINAGGPIGGTRQQHRALSAFLVTEIALVCLCLVATALIVTSFVRVTTADLGFDRHGLLTFGYRTDLGAVAERDRPAANSALRVALLDRLQAIPGVTGVAFSSDASGIPLATGGARYSLTIPGFGETSMNDLLDTAFVTPNYFDVLGMTLLRGRLFQASDNAAAARVMVINDVAARRFFRGRDPVGAVVSFQSLPTTVIGVVRAVHRYGPDADTRQAMYLPITQQPPFFFRSTDASGTVVVRETTPGARLERLASDAAHAALGNAVISPMRPIDQAFRRMTSARRFNTDVMAIFGLLSVTIGALGVYGTMAFVVARQVRTIGLRKALGASDGNVLRWALGAALGRLAVGGAIGLGVAWMTSGLFTSFLFGTRPTDPVVYGGALLLLTAVGLLAALIPALRASRIDPLIALRRE
jgi:predicted permease